MLCRWASTLEFVVALEDYVRFASYRHLNVQPVDKSSSARLLFMNARPGRPPKIPDGKPSTITLRMPPDVKDSLIEMSDALGLSMTDYVVALIRRDAGI